MAKNIMKVNLKLVGETPMRKYGTRSTCGPSQFVVGNQSW